MILPTIEWGRIRHAEDHLGDPTFLLLQGGIMLFAEEQK
jgi:hypothetical protein